MLWPIPMNSGNNKVVFVIGSLNIGGAEKQLSLLATELVKRGWETHLFSLEGDGPLKAGLQSAGVHVHAGGYDSVAPRWRKILLLVNAQWRLLRLAFTVRPRVMHAFLPLTNFMGALAGRMAGTRIIITSRRGLGTHQDNHRWWPWFDRVANYCSTAITANSQAVIDDTVRRDRVRSSKICLIYNGLNFPAPRNRASDRRVVRSSLGLTDNQIALVFVANLLPYKGHHELIAAFAQLHGCYKDLRLFLVGEDRGIGISLKNLANTLNVGSAIIHLGYRHDVARLLAGMDLGVLASHEEGCSNALLEKLAAGLPVVATAVGGNPEILADMPGCVLVSPKDSAGLARGIEKALGYGIRPLIDSQRIHSLATKFSVTRMVDSHELLYLKSNLQQQPKINESNP